MGSYGNQLLEAPHKRTTCIHRTAALLRNLHFQGEKTHLGRTPRLSGAPLPTYLSAGRWQLRTRTRAILQSTLSTCGCLHPCIESAEPCSLLHHISRDERPMRTRMNPLACPPHPSCFCLLLKLLRENEVVRVEVHCEAECKHERRLSDISAQLGLLHYLPSQRVCNRPELEPPKCCSTCLDCAISTVSTDVSCLAAASIGPPPA